jgi:uncharacterized protein YceK
MAEPAGSSSPATSVPSQTGYTMPPAMADNFVAAADANVPPPPASGLTGSMAALVERSAGRVLSTAELIDAILAEHGGAYGFPDPVTWPERTRRKPVAQWQGEVRALLRPGTHEPLHGRIVILGACLLDVAACRAVVESGLFRKLAWDLVEPLLESLDDNGLRLLGQVPLAATAAGRPATMLAALEPAADPVLALGWTTDGAVMAATGDRSAPTLTAARRGRGVLVWSDEDDDRIQLPADQGAVAALRANAGWWSAATPDGSRRARVVEGRVRVLTTTRLAAGEQEIDLLIEQRAGTIAISPDGQRVAAADDGRVLVVQIDRPDVVERIESPGAAPLLALPPRRGPLALAQRMDVTAGADRFQLAAPATAIAWDRDGLLLAVASEDAYVTLWSSRSRQVVAHVPVETTATALAFSPDGRTLAAGGPGRVVGIDVHLGRTRLATGYDSDSATDQRAGDLLGIDADVEALASVIAARAVVPPLSIGLFGEWGLGKSFFMRRLRDRVWDIAQEARQSGQVQQEVDFFKYVAQIEFNAWQYVEGNLWASLVQHIFSNLRIQSEDPEQRHRGELLLRNAGESVRRASEAVDRAQARQQAAMRKVVSIQGRLAREQAELTDLARRQAVGEMLRQERSGAVRAGLEPLGLSRTFASADDALTALGEARQVLRRWLPTLRVILDSPDPDARKLRVRLAAATLAGPAVAVVVAVAVAVAGRGSIAGIAGAAAGISAALAALAGWLRRQTEWASRLLTQVDAATTAIRDDLSKARGDLAEQKARAEQDLARTTTELGAALRARDEAKEVLADAELEHHRPTGELLARYIQDRADSDDYRKHLGLVALIHQDFEQLSDKVAKSLEWLEANEDLVLEEKQSKGRVDRIVLYIDDLDRCPPRRVVEVLEAVHLLLAFPLFVVVVGVDSRWVLQALRSHYAKLLQGDRTPQMATPLDYVEKIFQVPYQLQPLEASDTRSMLEGLLGGDAPVAAGLGAALAPAPSAEAPGGMVAAAPTTADDAVRERPAPRDLRPESLRITSEERAVMDQLAPLLGRTPRTVKRFLNVYRILKVRAQDRPGFLEDVGPSSEFRLTMLLLAVASGLPALAPGLLRAIDASPPETRLADLVVQGMRPEAQQQWAELDAWLAAAGPAWADLSVRDLDPVSQEVRRFTFVVA